MKSDVAAGGAMFVAALAAFAIANSPLHDGYEQVLAAPVVIGIAEAKLAMSLRHLINDGLMALFFLGVGLEIKREALTGTLSSIRTAMLPALAAAGGMAVPALVYVGLTRASPETVAGWPIPAATDIAFAVMVAALLGRLVPTELKVFLMALAVVDDIGAILIIAIAYAEGLSPLWMAAAGVVPAVVWGLGRMGVTRLGVYGALGLLAWFCVLKSGIHPTVGGVALAAVIPGAGGLHSPAHRLEDGLRPWVAFAVLPAFGLANAGVNLSGIAPADMLHPVALGIIAGLFLGKQIGITGASWLAVRMGLARLPPGTTWPMLHGVAILGGIGFTMSLFMGTLAFPDPPLDLLARIGVLVGSLLSAVVGALVLVAVGRR